jgi:hypothetical protein
MTRSPETQALIDKAMEIIGPTADLPMVTRGMVQTRNYVKRSSKSFIASGYYGEATNDQKKAAHRAAAEARAGSKQGAKKFFRDAVQDSLRPR